MKLALDYQSSWSLFGKRPGITLIRLAALMVGVFLVTRYLVTPTIVEGASMAPTLEEGQVLLMNRVAFLRKNPVRGDLVFVRHGRTLLIKRVVGLPGETVAMTNGAVWINQKVLSEPYTQNVFLYNYTAEELSSDEYLVIGDNRAIQQVLGKVRRAGIIGRPVGY